MLNKIKKMFMKKEETKEQIFEEQIKAQEESEAAAENIDSVPEHNSSPNIND